jgi:F0F1-type ATP synthase alpha subunit
MAITSGSFDKVSVEKIKQAEGVLLNQLKSKHAKLTEEINKGAKPTDAQNEEVVKVAKSVAKSYESSDKKAEAK